MCFFSSFRGDQIVGSSIGFAYEMNDSDSDSVVLTLRIFERERERERDDEASRRRAISV